MAYNSYNPIQSLYPQNNLNWGQPSVSPSYNTNLVPRTSYTPSGYPPSYNDPSVYNASGGSGLFPEIPQSNVTGATWDQWGLPNTVTNPDNVASMGNSGMSWNTAAIPDLGDTPATGSFWGDLTDMKGMGGGIIGLGQLGVGALNAFTGMQNYKAVKKHYENQDALAKVDFANNALSTNNALFDRNANRLSYGGVKGTANDTAQADYMKKWGVNGNIG